jgi:hypothetical protein
VGGSHCGESGYGCLGMPNRVTLGNVGFDEEYAVEID